jgi:selenocysteine lyase/cysteine desulfurase
MNEATQDQGRWAWLRAQTPALANTVYLNAGFQGPMSQPVADAMTDWLARELAEGPTSRPILEGRRNMGRRYREVVAQAFGADPNEIAITDNTTHGMNMVTAGLPVEVGDGVVTSGIEHASGLVPTYFLRERRGAELHIVPLSADDSAG